MIGYTFRFKMVKKTKNSGLERVAGLTPPLMQKWGRRSKASEVAAQERKAKELKKQNEKET